jgi:hypothetical protein
LLGGGVGVRRDRSLISHCGDRGSFPLPVEPRSVQEWSVAIPDGLVPGKAGRLFTGRLPPPPRTPFCQRHMPRAQDKVAEPNRDGLCPQPNSVRERAVSLLPGGLYLFCLLTLIRRLHAVLIEKTNPRPKTSAPWEKIDSLASFVHAEPGRRAASVVSLRSRKPLKFAEPLPSAQRNRRRRQGRRASRDYQRSKRLHQPDLQAA